MLERFGGADEARGHIAIGLGLIGDRRALPQLRELMLESTRRPQLFAQVATALGLLGDRELAAELIELLRTTRIGSVQPAIARALGQIGDQRSLAPLVDLLQDEDAGPLTRAHAALALGEIGDKDALDWSARLAGGMNYRACSILFSTAEGTGLLDR